MPHLVIESTELLSKEEVNSLHTLVGQLESVKIDNLKTRFYQPDYSFVATSDHSSHLAITLKLLPGRSDELKIKMAKAILKQARSLVEHPNVSVEIIELGIYEKI